MKSLIVKTLLILITGIWSICGGNVAYCNAAETTSYPSLHLEPVNTYYCSELSVGANSIKDQYPCYSPKQWLNNVTRTGFRNIYDYTDSEKFCSSGDCLDNPISVSRSYLFYYSATSSSPYQKAFRVYIPPGTLTAQLRISVPAAASVAVWGRFHQPPELTRWNELTYNNITPEMGGTLNEMKSQDGIFNNPGGSIYALNESMTNSEHSEGWFYVKVHSYDGNKVGIIKFALTVRLSDYLPWYEKMEANGWAGFDEAKTTVGSYDNDSSHVVTKSVVNVVEQTATVLDTTGSITGGSTNGTTTGGSTTTVFDNLAANIQPGGVPTGNTSEPDTTTPVVDSSTPGGSITGGSGSITGGATTPLEVTPPAPEYSPSIDLTAGQFVNKNVTLSELGARTKVILTPKFTIDTDTAGTYEHYAFLTEGTDLWIAQKDRLGVLVFTKFITGESLKSYKEANYTAGSNNWPANVFYELMDGLNYSPQALINKDAHFLVAVTPKGSFDKVWGAHLWVSP